MQLVKKNKALILSVLSVSIPAITEMSLNTLVGIADTLMISYIIGKEGLAAAGYANQIIFTIILVFSSFNIGATAMISRSYGEKNYLRLNQVLGQNLSLNIIIGIAMTIFSLSLGHRMMTIFETSHTVLEMSVSYFYIVSYSLVFMFISFAAGASLRGVSDTTTPMLVTGITNLLNIAGNYVLMTGFWIFPEMGIDGAALSTTVSRGIGTVLYIIVLLKGSHHLQLFFTNLKMSLEIIKPLWRLSYTAAIEQFLLQISFVVISIFVSYLDTTAEAAFRILLNIESLSFMPALGFSIAAASLVGKALGEQNQDKALHTGYIACGLGILWGICIGAIFVVFPAFIIRIFTSDIDIIKESIAAMIIAGIDQPFLAFMVIISGALRGAGDTKTVMVYNSLRLWLMFVPLSYIFIVYLNLGVKSIWIAEISAFLVFSMIMLKRFQSMKWAEIIV
jgi:putative MATE family efflux protein